MKRSITIMMKSSLLFVGASTICLLGTARSVNVEIPPDGETQRPITSTDPKDWSILSDLFPDNTLKSLEGAWESQPVFLPGSMESATQSTNLDTVKPLVGQTRTNSTNRFSHLFGMQDIGTVLSDPSLKHGSDYSVLKYLVRDGEEWSGKFPYETIPLDHIANLVNERAFSVVINKLQERWPAVSKMARSLELETMCHSVSCNLYLTPQGGARGFESHLDWMDVIVVQVTGTKDWSVWTEPLIHLCLPDEKRKPTRVELGLKQPATVTLSPGDALYIPRGFMHNATTPAKATSPSLHLTFGIEHECQTTMEALLHHALHLFVEEHQSTIANSIAISPSGRCNAAPGFSMGPGVTYASLLHLSISETVRRTSCGGFGEQTEQNRATDTAAICAMRQSVPLHPQIQQLDGRSTEMVEQRFINGLKAVLAHVSARNAVLFLNKVNAEPDPTANAIKYCFPQGNWNDIAYMCNPDLIPSSTQENLMAFAKGFLGYATDKFQQARARMVQIEAIHHQRKWEQILN